MKADLVSIIVPAYRHEDYVLDCLRSLHDQTYPRLELIFIDDHSPDRTFKLAHDLLSTRFGRRFENVVLRGKEENRGAHDSLNLGLSLAKGDYIAIVNSDDLFRPTRLQSLIGAMKDTGREFAFSIVETLGEDPEPGDAADSAPIPDALRFLGLRQRLAIASSPTVGFALLRQNVAISTGNFVFSAALARKVGAFLPLKYCHDWDFILQSLLYSEPLVIDEPLYDYRLHQANSFRAYNNVAELETDVTIRHFFRSLLRGRPDNVVCPSPHHWPGYFEAVIRERGYWPHWAREAGEALPGWRTIDMKAAGTAPIGGTEIRSRVDAFQTLRDYTFRSS